MVVEVLVVVVVVVEEESPEDRYTVNTLCFIGWKGMIYLQRNAVEKLQKKKQRAEGGSGG